METCATGEPSRRLAVSFLLALALALLAGGGLARADILFHDDFNGSLDPAWSILRPDASFYTVEPTGLRLRCNQGDLWGWRTDSRNLFLIVNPALGDFTVTARLRWLVPPTINYGQFNLLAYDDDDNHVRLIHGFTSGDLVINNIVEVGGQFSARNDTVVNVGTNWFWLQMRKQGTTYSGWYSTNGVNFSQASSPLSYGDGTPLKLGLVAMRDDSQTATALIDSFTVETRPSPCTFTDDFAAGLSPSAWQVISNVPLYTVDTAQGAVRFSKPAGGSYTFQYVGLALRTLLSGDFDVSVDFTNASINRSDGSPGNQVQLNTDFGGQDFLVVRSDEACCGHTTHIWLWPQAQWGGSVAYAGTSGRLRVVRTGAHVQGFVNNTLLYEGDYNTNDARVTLTLQNNGTRDATAVTFDNFSASADFCLPVHEYTLDWWTVDGGGSDTLSVGQFTLAGTVGQPDACAPQAVGHYTLSGGFWAFLATAPQLPPFITSALTATGRVNRPFSYAVTATGSPTGYGASGLPAGLSVNTISGLISGTPSAAGAFNVLLSATNATGVVTTNLLLSIADNAPVQWASNGHWYQAVYAGTSGISWPDASTAATNAGGYLATITSADENAFAYALVSDPIFWFTDSFGNGVGPWLGGLQPPGSPEPAGNWQWVTGEPMAYLNWAPGEPTNWQGVEDRLHFFGAQTAQGPQWNDAGAAALFRGYLIEYPQFPWRPTLSIALSNAAVLISWPSANFDWALEFATNLVPGGSGWMEIPRPYPTNATDCVVTEPTPAGNKFYRLRMP